MVKQLKHPKLKYTICFLFRGDEVLMLHRARIPNKHKWNGVGGKIEPGENILPSMKREIQEEVGIDIPLNKLNFEGIVNWEIPNQQANGMYVFTAEIKESPFAEKAKETPEGLLSWKKLSWVINKKNEDVVDNIHYFLPAMLKTKEPIEYTFSYDQQMTMNHAAMNQL